MRQLKMLHPFKIHRYRSSGVNFFYIIKTIYPRTQNKEMIYSNFMFGGECHKSDGGITLEDRSKEAICLSTNDCVSFDRISSFVKLL